MGKFWTTLHNNSTIYFCNSIITCIGVALFHEAKRAVATCWAPYSAVCLQIILSMTARVTAAAFPQHRRTVFPVRHVLSGRQILYSEGRLCLIILAATAVIAWLRREPRRVIIFASSSAFCLLNTNTLHQAMHLLAMYHPQHPP
jgi:hypothetical protein